MIVGYVLLIISLNHRKGSSKWGAGLNNIISAILRKFIALLFLKGPCNIGENILSLGSNACLCICLCPEL